MESRDVNIDLKKRAEEDCDGTVDNALLIYSEHVSSYDEGLRKRLIASPDRDYSTLQLVWVKQQRYLIPPMIQMINNCFE